MLKAETLKIHCDICGHNVPREKACQVALIFGAYTPGKEGKKVERNEVCEDCARHLQNLMTCRPREEKPEKPKKPAIHNKECRCITIARIRAGLFQSDLASLIYYDDGTVSAWEQGRGSPDWGALTKALPELAEIREKGCAAYCDNTEACAGGGRCYYGKRMPNKRKNEKD